MRRSRADSLPASAPPRGSSTTNCCGEQRWSHRRRPSSPGGTGLGPEFLDGLTHPGLSDRMASATHWLDAGDRRRAFQAFRAAASASEKMAPSQEAFALWSYALGLIRDDPAVASEAEHREVFGRACHIMVSASSWQALVEAEKAARPHATGTLGWFFRCWTYNWERELGNDVPNFLSREQLDAVLDQFSEEAPDALLAATLFEVSMTAEWHGYSDRMEATAAVLAKVDAPLPLEVRRGWAWSVVTRIATLRGRDAAPQRLGVAKKPQRPAGTRTGALSLGCMAFTPPNSSRMVASTRALQRRTRAWRWFPVRRTRVTGISARRMPSCALWLTGQWDASLALAERWHDAGWAVFHRFQAAVRRGEPPPTEVTDSDEADRSPDTYPWVCVCRSLAVAESALLAHDERAPISLRATLEDLSVLGLRSGEGLNLLAEMASGLPGPRSSPGRGDAQDRR